MAHFKNRKPKAFPGHCWLCSRKQGPDVRLLRATTADESLGDYDPEERPRHELWASHGRHCAQEFCAECGPLCCVTCSRFCGCEDDADAALEWVTARMPFSFTLADHIR
jgi:hypothetical protein